MANKPIANRKSVEGYFDGLSVGWPKVTRVPIPAGKSQSFASSQSCPSSPIGSRKSEPASPSFSHNITSPRLSPPKGLPPWILARKGRSSQKVQSTSSNTSPGGAGLPPWARKYVGGSKGGGGKEECAQNKMMGWEEVQARQMPPKRR